MRCARAERELYANKLWPAFKKMQRLRSLTIGGMHDGRWLTAVAKDLNIGILLATHYYYGPLFDARVNWRVDPQTQKISKVHRAYPRDSEGSNTEADEDSDENTDEDENRSQF